MKYTEKLEALNFAISCVDQVHSDGAGDSFLAHIDNTSKCDCRHGIVIRRLKDEALTTQCAIDAVARRGKKGGSR